VLLPSGREARAEINTIIQDKLRAEGTLKGDGRSFMVREQVNLTHEELRSRLWGTARFLEVARGDNSLGLRAATTASSAASPTAASAWSTSRANAIASIPEDRPLKSRDGLRLAIEKEIRIHEASAFAGPTATSARGAACSMRRSRASSA
jgi:hypothetical protein